LLYRRIRDLREDNDLTQEYIGRILNVDQRTYSNYENDRRQIPIEVLGKLADFYNTSVDYLIGRTDERKPYPSVKK
jgi:transcriptional regulator with XRE-family HTH domain